MWHGSSVDMVVAYDTGTAVSILDERRITDTSRDTDDRTTSEKEVARRAVDPQVTTVGSST